MVTKRLSFPLFCRSIKGHGDLVFDNFGRNQDTTTTTKSYTYNLKNKIQDKLDPFKTTRVIIQGQDGHLYF